MPFLSSLLRTTQLFSLLHLSTFISSQPSHPALSRTKPKRKVVVVVNEDEFNDQDYVGDEEDEVHEGSDDEDDMNFKFNDS
jgi:hypothetical protein